MIFGWDQEPSNNNDTIMLNDISIYIHTHGIVIVTGLHYYIINLLYKYILLVLLPVT